MTRYAPQLTDERLRQALSELAAGPTGSDLLLDVLRTVDSTAQVGRRPWDVRGWGRPVLVLAAILLITGAIGLAVAASPRPQPQPTPTAPAPLSNVIRVSDFVVPFTYRLPAADTVRLQAVGAVPGVLLRRETTSPTRRLELFFVYGSAHTCDRDGTFGIDAQHTVMLDQEPVAFLEGLRDTVGIGIGPIRGATLGNLPAVAADIDPARNVCGTNLLHEQGLGINAMSLEPKLDDPGTIIVARTGDTTIAVLITATEDDLAEWLPIAHAYVDTLVFSPPEGQ